MAAASAATLAVLKPELTYSAFRPSAYPGTTAAAAAAAASHEVAAEI